MEMVVQEAKDLRDRQDRQGQLELLELRGQLEHKGLLEIQGRRDRKEYPELVVILPHGHLLLQLMDGLLDLTLNIVILVKLLCLEET